MNLLSKQKKLVFQLAVIAILMAHYYVINSTSWLLSDSNLHLEWPLLVDLLVTIPLIYFFIFRPKLKQFLLKSLVFFGLGIVVGSFIIPKESQQLWPYLLNFRYLIIAGFVLVELSLIFSLIHIIKNLNSKNSNAELEIESFLERKGFSNTLKELYLLEARVWLYAFFSKKVNFKSSKEASFSYANYHGNASNQQGFIFIILFELPIAHLILHFAWSPVAANWITGLTAYGLIFMYADYKATLTRPITLSAKELIIRYGVWGNLKVPLSAIDSVTLNNKPVKRSKNILRFCQFGDPNACISLKPNTELQTAFGKSKKDKVFLGIDNPGKFLETFSQETSVS